MRSKSDRLQNAPSWQLLETLPVFLSVYVSVNRFSSISSFVVPQKRSVYGSDSLSEFHKGDSFIFFRFPFVSELSKKYDLRGEGNLFIMINCSVLLCFKIFFYCQ